MKILITLIMYTLGRRVACWGECQWVWPSLFFADDDLVLSLGLNCDK